MSANQFRIHMYPFRLQDHANEPANRDLCEWECGTSDGIRDRLGYGGYAEYVESMSKTRDERQCRGCGRWGIFEPRAITSNLPDGSVVRGPGIMFINAGAGWVPVGTVDGFVERPASACPCCTSPAYSNNDCWCPEDCGVHWCQMGDPA